jgi:acyl-CoA dehydrogenase
VPRELWLSAGENGFLCPWAEEKYGGIEADFLSINGVGEAKLERYGKDFLELIARA